MAAVVNGSYALPAADAEYVLDLAQGHSGLLSYVYNGMNGWSMVLASLLMSVVYDQSERETVAWASAAEKSSNPFSSQLSLAKRLHSRTKVEDSVHWAFPRLRLPQDGQVQGEMGVWRPELCFRISQVNRIASKDVHTRQLAYEESLGLSSLLLRETWHAKFSTLLDMSNHV